MRIVVANINPEFNNLIEKLKVQYPGEVLEIKEKNGLNFEVLSQFQPDYVFFTHWSYIIKADIFENFNCVVFHMTDLPYGRGGSPLQNLIVRGHKETMLSAIKVSEGIDEGDLYLKKPLLLDGTAREIFARASVIASEMVEEIIENKLDAEPQQGEITLFSRRKPQDSCIKSLQSLSGIYDYIRMLDADGYPHAFLEMDEFRLTFTDAQLVNGKVEAKVEFIPKSES
jgi:methionyl-tRNA formyltransferase